LGDFSSRVKDMKLLICSIALSICTLPSEVLVSLNLKPFFLQTVSLFEDYNIKLSKMTSN